MSEDVVMTLRKVHELVDEYRATCLWFLRADYYPETPEEACTTLASIERHGNAEAFKKAATLRQWLLRNSNLLSHKI